MNPSTAQLLEAVEAAPADEVVVLPNNKNIIPVAEQVDAQTTKAVRVVPTRGIAEGFAALVAYDPEAAGRRQRRRAWPRRPRAVVAGEVTRAVRDSHLRGGRHRTRATTSASPATASARWRTGLDGAAIALLDVLVDDEPRDRHRHRGRGRHRGRPPGASPSGWTSTVPA